VPEAKFLVLRDQDAEDCREVKKRLQSICLAAGKSSVLVRIACRELESWYLGDLAAVERGLGIPKLSSKQMQAKYRQPDGLANASEELAKLTASRYQKVSGSRAIGPHLDPTNRRSRSFAIFIVGLIQLIADVRQEPNTDNPESDS